MNDQELRQVLEELHQKIESAESVDERGRELLRHLDADIRSLLERTERQEDVRGADPENPEMGRLEESVRYFEVTHPTLTATLSQLLNILNNAGI